MSVSKYNIIQFCQKWLDHALFIFIICYHQLYQYNIQAKMLANGKLELEELNTDNRTWAWKSLAVKLGKPLMEKIGRIIET